MRVKIKCSHLISKCSPVLLFNVILILQIRVESFGNSLLSAISIEM